MSYQNNKPKMTDPLYDAVKAVSDSQPSNFFAAILADQAVEDGMVRIIENVIRIDKWDEIMLKYKERTAIAAALVQVRTRIINEYEFTRDGAEAQVPRLKFKGVQVKATKKQKPQEITAENAGDTQMGAAMLKAAEQLPAVKDIQASDNKTATKKAAPKKPTAKKAAPKKTAAKAKAKTEEKAVEAA